MTDGSTIRYTYQDYLTIPEDSSRRHEIVDGELYVTPAPRPRHQRVVTDLARILENLVAGHDLGDVFVGPIGVRLREEGEVEPDRILKRKQYMAHGVPELWVVDADEHTVEVWRPDADRPRVVRDTLEWNVGGRRFEIRPADPFET